MKKFKLFADKCGETAFLVGVLLFLLVFGPAAPAIWNYASQNPGFSLGLLVGLFPAAVSAYIAFAVQNKKEKSEYQKWLLEKREAVFAELVSVIGGAVESTRVSEIATVGTSGEIAAAVRKCKPKLAMWAPASLLRDWRVLEESCEIVSSQEEFEDALWAIDDFFRAFRKELGHDDSALARGELVRVFLDSEDAMMMGFP
ncbi:MAG: hypothetical protein MPL62_12855 [Alphaproteobacteria bacterium]|nr:hypothetical protein [Alphaproteobacteria bacterium]